MTAATPHSEGTEERHAQAVALLERRLELALRYGQQLDRQLFRAMRADLKTARKRAVAAERKLERAVRRAESAEAELQALRESATVKVGRAVLAGPRRVRRLKDRG